MYYVAALAFAALLAPGSTASVSSGSGGGDEQPPAFPAGGFYMVFWVLYDDAFIEGFGGGAEAEIDALFAQLQGIFSEESLGTTIKPLVKGKRKVAGKWSATDDNLDKLKAHVSSANEYPDVNAYVMLSYDDGRPQLGTSVMSSTCARERRFRVSIVEHTGNLSDTAGLLAHEIGHNLGMEDDDDDECGGGGGYMADSGARDHWSSCSSTYLLDYYSSNRGFCLEPMSPQAGQAKKTTTTTEASIDCKTARDEEPDDECEAKRRMCISSSDYRSKCQRTCLCREKKDGCYDLAEDFNYPEFCKLPTVCKGSKKELFGKKYCSLTCGFCKATDSTKASNKRTPSTEATTTEATALASIDCKTARNGKPDEKCEAQRLDCLSSPNYIYDCQRTCLCSQKKAGCYDKAEDFDDTEYCRQPSICNGPEKQFGEIYCRSTCGYCE